MHASKRGSDVLTLYLAAPFTRCARAKRVDGSANHAEWRVGRCFTGMNPRLPSCAAPYKLDAVTLKPVITGPSFSTARSIASARALGLAALASALAFGVSACAPTALSSARQKIAAGQYAAAREELLALESHEGDLTGSQRREVKDDLCLSDFVIGQPSFSLSEQRRVCAEAAKEPGSQSAQLVERIDAATRKSSAQKVTAALDRGDLADAEEAALVYVDTPGSDPRVMTEWSQRMWEIVRRQDQRNERKKKQLTDAIAEVRKQYPAMKSMSKSEYLEWVAKQGTVGQTRMFSAVSLKDSTTTLAVRRAEVQSAALNLDRLTRINDALVARCGCDARTNVGIAETDFPLYLVRLDPETQRSEVLILPHE